MSLLLAHPGGRFWTHTTVHRVWEDTCAKMDPPPTVFSAMASFFLPSSCPPSLLVLRGSCAYDFVHFRIMGKRSKQDLLSIDQYSEKLFTVADANGYESGRHRDEDSERSKFRYMAKSIQLHDSALRRYLA